VDSFIQFSDLTEQLSLSELNALRPWITETAKQEGFAVGDLRFVFCHDNYLHNINVEFLQHDTFTDIITFDYSTENTIAGEIYISYDRVLENASLFQQQSQQELKRIVIHGVLHLLGYADKQAKDKALMTSKEDYYLSLLPDLEK